jgi:sigma-B regulation protein RsbU (phosphoserine phosphatase)
LIVLSTKEEPKIKAEAFTLGANDYLVKLPDKLELVARVRYHSRGYINLLERNEAYRALQASQRLLAKDVAQAARYVQSLLPEKLRKGPIAADWRFVPSAELGGDSFGYDWVDADHFAFYLLDVSGHGVGSALLSVSALNALRSQSLPQADFRDPGQVLTALNRAFQMDQQNGLFFTIWYGIYHRPTRRLDYSGGGHPPALLLSGPDADHCELTSLESRGPMIGAVGDLEYATSTCQVGPYGFLALYSDGAFEIEQAGGKTWPFGEFVRFMEQAMRGPGSSGMDPLIAHARALQGADEFADDLSMVEIRFPPPD